MDKLIQEMESAQDLVSTRQLKELNEKFLGKQAHIAFCGHFSAGKSSLINRLCEHELLPSSPIPTSANVVSIHGGSTAEAIVYRNDKYEPESVPLDQLSNFAVDGADIRTVDIRYPARLLNEYRIVLYDTPGIDSTDEAHHRATSSALHMADIVFYVTDYNHVQSETNFVFLQRLQAMGKAIVLLINQIDKHREQEIHFREYHDRVEQSLQAWEIYPEATLYLSLREPSHPYSQFDDLVRLIEQFGDASEAWNTFGIHRASQEAIRNHMKRRKASHQEMTEKLAEDMRLEAADAVLDVEKQRFQSQIQTILDNAPVIPALLRDRAHAFVESCEPSFKVGFLGAKKKTEQERKRRAEEFLKGLKEQVLASIVVHLNQLAREPLDWMEEWDEEWLRSKVNPGAMFNYEYTMQYAKELEQTIKTSYRRRMNTEVDHFMKQLQQDPAAIESKRAEQMDELKPSLPSYQQMEQLEQQEQAVEKQLMAFLEEVTGPDPVRPKVIQPKMEMAGKLTVPQENKIIVEAISEVEEKYEIPDLKAQAKPLIKQIDSALEILDQHPLFVDQQKRLFKQRNKLVDATFTIALFGAFSAGKSSFVNALIGQDVLPVSPNPTTAAVNRILPPNEIHTHGTAVVILKTRQRLSQELEAVMHILGLPFQSIEKTLSQADRIQAQDWKGQARTQAAFIAAAAAGWDRLHEQLGERIEVDLAAYRTYAANEEYSCFVEQIDLYYDSPLSRQGLILVDTPGADSINARHTGVAFQTIKEADAILYVTYYNHAFSQADQEFLIQLGRMKSTVSLNNLFFMINAADLASDQYELDAVKQHVAKQLASFELHDVKLFAVSSHMGLQGRANKNAKQWRSSGLPEFEEAFYDFVRNHLLQATFNEIRQSMQELAASWKAWIEQNQLAESEKKQHQALMNDRMKQLPQTLDEAAGGLHKTKLEQEVQERVFYVKQRTHYRFGELFRHTFHPSVLQDNSKTLRRDLAQAHKQLWDLLVRYVAGEMMTLMWGVEKSISSLLDEHNEAFLTSVRGLFPDITPAGIREEMNEELVSYSVQEKEERPETKEKWLLRQFRNSRYFFEEDGKSQLRKQLEDEMLPALDLYADACGQSAVAHYQVEHEKLIEQLKNRWSDHTKRAVQLQIESLDQDAVKNHGADRLKAYEALIHESAEIGTH